MHLIKSLTPILLLNLFLGCKTTHQEADSAAKIIGGEATGDFPAI